MKIKLKLTFSSRNGTPTKEQTKRFLNIIENFIQKNPTQLIGVHCTHGFNRTGFLICSYLVEKLDYSIDMALQMFAEFRPFGIYKQDYIDELFRRYADRSVVIPKAAFKPNWNLA